MRNLLLVPLCAVSFLGLYLAAPLHAQAITQQPAAKLATTAQMPATAAATSATTKATTATAGTTTTTADATTTPAVTATATARATTAAPDWQRLDRYQAHSSKTDFVGQLNTIFAPHGAAAQTMLIGKLGANILTQANAPRKSYYLLTFAPQTDSQAIVRDSAGRQIAASSLYANNDDARSKAVAQADHSKTAARTGRSKPAAQGGRYWKSSGEIRKEATAARLLAGLHVAIDPGHIGGNWAFMEQREWSFGGGPVFREGDFVLRVAEILAADLRALGATVTLVRDNKEPLTEQRPEDFVERARTHLKSRTGTEPTETQVRRQSELEFYRIAEIRARAQKVNDEIQPDIVICLHVDGTSFPPSGATELPRGGTLHVLVNGAYSAEELADDDQRLAMLERMLSGASAEEIALADTVAHQLAIDTGLPPMTYTGSNAVRVNDNPFVWGRNLIANRLYDAPTVYIEAYTANREPFYQRFAHGEYEGTRLIDGSPRKNVYREYADSVRDALLKHYAQEK